MPKSIFDEFPINSFEQLKSDFPRFLEYMRSDFNNTYGIGTDTAGTLDFTNNLADPAGFSGTTSNIFTLDTDDTGGDVSLVFGTTNAEYLKWIDSENLFELSDDLRLLGSLIMNDNSITGIDNITFTDINGAIAGISNRNLLDKTASETITGDWTFSGETSGIDHSDLDELEWSVAGHIIDTDIVMNDNSITGIDTLTFTDINGTIAGIENQNLLDKTANESLSGLYTWTAGGIILNDNIPLQIGTGGNDIGTLTLNTGTPNVLDLILGSDADFSISTDALSDIFYVDGTNNNVSIGVENAPSGVLFVSGTRSITGTKTPFFAQYIVDAGSGIGTSITSKSSLNINGIAVGGGNDYISQDGQISLTSIGVSSIGRFVGYNNSLVFINTSAGITINDAIGMNVELKKGSANTVTTNVTNFSGIKVSSNTALGGGTIAITNARGIYIEDFPATEMTITSAAGIWLDKQTGGTTNYGLVLNGDENGSDLVLGGSRNNRIYSETTTNHLVLKSDSVGTGAVKTTAGRIINTTRLTSGDSPYTVLATDHIIICDTDGGAIEVDLTAGVEGKEYRVSNVGSSGNDVTVDPNGTEEVFSGGAGVAFVMTDTEGITINFNATEGWW